MRHDEWATQSAGNNRSDLEAYVEELRAKGDLPAIEAPPSPPIPAEPEKNQNDPFSENKSGGNTEGLGSNEFAVRPGQVAAYTAAQVLNGWRAYIGGANQRVEMPRPDPANCADWDDGEEAERAQDFGGAAKRASMHAHAERFWAMRIELFPMRAWVLMGWACLEFEDWYQGNPLFIPVEGLEQEEGGFTPWEREWLPIQDAVDLWNQHQTDRTKKVTYKAALEAAREDVPRKVFARLLTIRPDGKIYTRGVEIERWIESDGRRRNKAA